MRGSIQKRGRGSWRLVFDLERHHSGKRRQKVVSFKGNKRDAEAPAEHVDWAGTADANGAWSMLVANTIDVTGTASLVNPQFTLPPDPADLPDITRPMLIE